MEPIVLDDIYFILDVWICVNEIVIMEAWINGVYSIG
jgi:hypothetical protein